MKSNQEINLKNQGEKSLWDSFKIILNVSNTQKEDISKNF